jgi:hypothetical protein
LDGTVGQTRYYFGQLSGFPNQVEGRSIVDWIGERMDDSNLTNGLARLLRLPQQTQEDGPVTFLSAG